MHQEKEEGQIRKRKKKEEVEIVVKKGGAKRRPGFCGGFIGEMNAITAAL